jgi:hypothetical protein
MPRPSITLRALRHPRRLKRLKEWLLAGETIDLVDQGEIIGEFIPVARDATTMKTKMDATIKPSSAKHRSDSDDRAAD